MTTICIGRVAGGKLVEVWAEGDMLGVMQEIGAILLRLKRPVKVAIWPSAVR